MANGGSGFGFDGHERRNGKDGIASNNGSMRRSNRRKARPSPLRKGARAEDASSASGENDGQEAGEPGALGENEEEGGDAWEGGFSASSDEEDDEEGDPTHVVGRSPSKKSKLSVTKKQTRPAARKGKGRAAERDHAETNVRLGSFALLTLVPAGLTHTPLVQTSHTAFPSSQNLAWDQIRCLRLQTS